MLGAQVLKILLVISSQTDIFFFLRDCSILFTSPIVIGIYFILGKFPTLNTL